MSASLTMFALSDTAVVGICGIAGTAIVAPLVGFFIRKHEDTRRDTVAAIDGAVDALITARSNAEWLRARNASLIGHSAAVAVEIRRAEEQLQAADAYATRLVLRLGKEHPVTASYTAAIDVIINREMALAGGGPSVVKPSTVEATIGTRTAAFIAAARRWHEDEMAQG